MINFFKKSNKDFRDRVQSVLREYSEGLILAVLFAVILRSFVITAYRIPSEAMAPSLQKGDFVFAYRLPFGMRLPFVEKKVGVGKPKRGEVVVFECPHRQQEWCIKRIIGLEGDRIEIRGERLVVNGELATYQPEGAGKLGFLLKEKLFGMEQQILIQGSSQRSRFGPYVVPPGSVFMLADNRDQGGDSRTWGPVPIDNLEARVQLIWLSLNWREENEIAQGWPSVRWARLFQSVD